MSIKGEAEKSDDLIALTGLYIDGEGYCKHQPLSAKQGKKNNNLNILSRDPILQGMVSRLSAFLGCSLSLLLITLLLMKIYISYKIP